MTRTRPILTIIIGSIMLGMIGLGLNTLFGYNTVSYLVLQRTNDIIFYRYDIWAYLENIKNEILNTAHIELAWNPREWLNTSAGILDSKFWNVLNNNLAFMLNWLIFAINILIYPMRIGGYVLGATFAVIGLNTITIDQNPLGWLINFANFMEEIQIPYV